MLQRWKCIISYDGSQFFGYQVQPEKRTVQGELEKALTKMHKGEAVKVYASGRTDATVHAYGQVIHFDSPLCIEPMQWKKALNALLPDDIALREVERADATFHARFDVKKKEYRYKIRLTEDRDVFTRHYVHQFPYHLNVEAIQEAMTYLLGTHDFTSFCSAKTEVEDKVRTIYEASIHKENEELIFRFVGDGFLYNMVRIIVGTLLEVGQGKRAPEEIKKILQGQDRSLAGKTAPGQGLYLWKVYYDN